MSTPNKGRLTLQRKLPWAPGSMINDVPVLLVGTVGLLAQGGSFNFNNWGEDGSPFAPVYAPELANPHEQRWGNAADDNTLDLPVAIGFSLDIGAFYTGSPDVVLTDSSGVVPVADLLAEQAQIEDDLSGFKFYPVITVGIHIRF